VNRLAIPVVTVLIVASLAIGDQPPSAPTRTNPLVGRWQILSMGMRKLPDDVKVFWTFDETSVVVTDDGGHVASKSHYSLRDDGEHHVIALSVDGKKELNRVGWYEQKDGKLRLQVTLDAGKPPERWNEDEVMLFRAAPEGARPGAAPTPRG